MKEITEILRAFQEGYTKRDITKVEKFVEELFVEDDDVLVIGTCAISPTCEEWCQGLNAVKNIIRDDWKYWGDVKYNIDDANIMIENNTAIVSLDGIVSEIMTTDSYLNYRLELVKKTIEENKNPKLTLLEIMNGISNTLVEIEKGENYNWPIRLSLVLVKKNGKYKIKHIHFSYPITFYPQVRL